VKLFMENEVVVQVDGIKSKRAADKIVGQITQMPGVEMVDVNLKRGRVSVTGGDLDQMYIVDVIESMGYTAIS